MRAALVGLSLAAVVAAVGVGGALTSMRTDLTVRAAELERITAAMADLPQKVGQPEVAAFTQAAPMEGGPFVTTAGGKDTVAREPRVRTSEG